MSDEKELFLSIIRPASRFRDEPASAARGARLLDVKADPSGPATATVVDALPVPIPVPPLPKSPLRVIEVAVEVLPPQGGGGVRYEQPFMRRAGDRIIDVKEAGAEPPKGLEQVLRAYLADEPG